MKIGFKVIAYENNEPCDYGTGPSGCQNKRERGEAQNLIDRILKWDPSAKIVVHAGYGHIDKMGTDAESTWIPMAKYYEMLSGIDPFTVDQTEFLSQDEVRCENPSYRALVNYFDIRRPISVQNGKCLSFPCVVEACLVREANDAYHLLAAKIAFVIVSESRSRSRLEIAPGGSTRLVQFSVAAEASVPSSNGIEMTGHKRERS